MFGTNYFRYMRQAVKPMAETGMMYLGNMRSVGSGRGCIKIICAYDRLLYFLRLFNV